MKVGGGVSEVTYAPAGIERVRCAKAPGSVKVVSSAAEGVGKAASAFV